jgi:hypothetical protein
VYRRRRRIEIRNRFRRDHLVGAIVRGTPEYLDQAVADASALSFT